MIFVLFVLSFLTCVIGEALKKQQTIFVVGSSVALGALANILIAEFLMNGEVTFDLGTLFTIGCLAIHIVYKVEQKNGQAKDENLNEETKVIEKE